MGAGRPRKFCEDQILDDAARLFQELGFDGVAVPDLVDKLGISRQSLYKLFGDKRGFFLKAMDRYVAAELAPMIDALRNDPDPLGVIDRLLDSWEPRTANRTSCLLVRTAGSTDDDEIRRLIGRHLDSLADATAEALARSKAAGDLRPDTDTDALAGALTIATQGVSAVCSLPGSERHVQHATAGVRAMIAAART